VLFLSVLSDFQGGLRVPLIAHWPAVIRSGRECGALVGMNDLMATFAELADGKISTQDAPDSVSFAKLLRNPEAKGTRQNLIMQSIGPFVVRDGDWKLCLCPGSGASGKIGNEPTPEDAWQKAIEQFGKTPNWTDLSQAPFVQLFNVANDLHEDHNLAAEHPERVARMVALLRRQIQDGRSTAGPKLANGRDGININQRVPTSVRKKLK